LLAIRCCDQFTAAGKSDPYVKIYFFKNSEVILSDDRVERKTKVRVPPSPPSFSFFLRCFLPFFVHFFFVPRLSRSRTGSRHTRSLATICRFLFGGFVLVCPWMTHLSAMRRLPRAVLHSSGHQEGP